MTVIDYYKSLNIDDKVINFCLSVENELGSRFAHFDQIGEINQIKVLKAMQDAGLSEAHFGSTTGYGYNDIGRDKIEEIYAKVFRTEDALVRPQIISGTHALTVALFGNLRPGDEILSPVGAPYDTLHGVIGISGNGRGSLKEYGIEYRQVDLLEDSTFDYENIKKSINDKTRLVTIQRSKGYSTRKTLSVESIGQLINFIKSINDKIICMVDNCYGEFIDIIEPSDVGADMVVGSLIKNIGGGLAPIGGYIVGKSSCIEDASYRLSAPGLGKEVGASLGINLTILQGLFFAPTVAISALKGAVFAANVYERLGFKCYPNAEEDRHDIIQAISLNSADNLLAFCKGVQAAAPVDSFVTPYPAPMPGYDCDVIMAAGAFISGASIEFSADAPMKEPYNVYFQGGLTWHHAKYGIIKTVQTLYEKGLIKL